MEKKVNILEPKVYIPNFLSIRNKNGELVKLKPNRAQKKLQSAIDTLEAKGKPVRLIILKARQMGFSTYTEALAFNKTSTNSFYNTFIIAHEEQASQNLYNMFKTFYEFLPDVLKPMRKRNNSKELLFENPTSDDIEKHRNPGLKSSVKVSTANNSKTGRSQTLNFVHCSEVAFWDNAEETVTGLFQCVPMIGNSVIILESTANGIGGFFYDTWQKAEAGENDFVPLFFGWWEEDTYEIEFQDETEKKLFINGLGVEEEYLVKFLTEKGLDEDTIYRKLRWRKWCIANNCYGDIDKFHQEYPTTPDEAFIASGRPRFDIQKLKEYKLECREGERGFLEYQGDKVIFVPNKRGYLEIWKKPEQETYYGIGADVAEGLAKGDFSVGYVGDSDFNVVARWRGHIEPDLFGKELVKLGKYYNEAYIGCENNNHGLTTLKAMEQEEYYNLYFTKTFDKLTDKITQKLGWTTSNKSKPLMINKLAEWIREKYLKTIDAQFVKEAITYVIDDKGATNAQEGCYDDCVMSMGILVQVLLEGKSDSFVPYLPEETVNGGTYSRIGLKFARDEDIDEENKLEIAD